MGKYTTVTRPDIFKEYKERYREIRQEEQKLTELRNGAYEFDRLGDQICNLSTDREDKETKIAIAGKMYYKAGQYKCKADELEAELKALRNALKLRVLWRYEQ